MALAPAAGCGGPARDPAADASPVRLIDRLESARIDSPLRGLAPTAALMSRGTAVWSSRAALAAATGPPPGLRLRGDCRPTAEGTLRCRQADGRGFRVGVRLRVEPGSTYRVAARLRGAAAGCVVMSLRDVDRVRWLTPPNTGGEWREIDELWLSGHRASRLRIGLRGDGEGCEVEAALEVSRLDPGRELELALFRDALAPDRGPAAGPAIAAFGSFLPLGDAETVAAPHDENFSQREVLLAPAPTELWFPLRVPEGSSLRFSYALSRLSRLGDAVDFEIAVRPAGGDERRLWSRRLELTEASWHWHEAAVDLAALGGRRVELGLRTRAGGGRGLALWGMPTVVAPRAAGAPPNVVLIAVDTLRADRLSAYGYSRPTSPRLAELAADGVLFDQAISQSNWTVPSFASIFTGRVVPGHRLLTTRDRLAPEIATLAERFREAGWRTRALLYKPALFGQLGRGFEAYTCLPRRFHQADQNLAKAVDWLRRAGDQRFFLFLHFNDPHLPFTHPAAAVAPETRAELARLGLELPLDLPRDLDRCAGCTRGDRLAPAFKSLVHRLYDEEVAYVDDRIGRLLDELRRLDLYDDAIIAFVSDHGETLWDHFGYYGHGGPNHHDELIRVPLIVKPGRGEGWRRGEIERTPVRAFDLMPTLLELSGAAAPDAAVDALSLVPWLESGAPPPPRAAFSQNDSAGSLRHGRWQYVYPVAGRVFRDWGREARLEREELYDLSRPSEARGDVSDEHPEVVRDMRRLVMEHLVETLGGRFLVVVGDGAGERLVDVEAGAATSWDPLARVGLMEQPGATPRAVSFAGSAAGHRLLLLARFEAAPEIEMRVELRGDGRPAGDGPWRLSGRRALAFQPGLLERLARPAGAAAYLIEAGERTVAPPAPAREMDAQQEAALRALGYLP